MAYTDFFQSDEFAEFQEKIPYRGRSWILILKHPKARCVVIRQKLRFGKSMLWVPYGPVIETEDSEGWRDAFEAILEDFKRIAKEENAIFCRIEPPLHKNFMKLGKWKPAFGRWTPEKTLVLDLSKSEEELLSEMKEKGRYNIGLAKRHEVTVQHFYTLQEMGAKFAFDEFYKLLEKTAERDQFHSHPKSFYKTFLEALGPKKMAALFVAQHEGKIIGGIVVVFYGDTATYYYGASDYEHRNLMAPYLLQWEALREAKKQGFIWYDLFGLEWGRVSEFKEKFGGKIVEFPKAFDIVYQPFWYWLIKLKRRFT